ncbi:MAG: molecular chaperone HtpG [Opitutales bacterium]|nr:molecular chaperone HtpG [Opitutales bacterium]
MSTQAPEKHSFQAEVQQLLDIVINSLYTDKEIFIRELVSNAADSLEKLRHHQLKGETVFDDKLPLEVNITTDDTAGTITIQDFGIGLTEQELVENLGTIAHSGSKAFASALKEARAEGSDPVNLIGQFGVGFYSAFMVASEVKVYTHSFRPEGENLLWTSDGAGSYTIAKTEDTQRRGARIVVKLKEEFKEFSNKSRVEDVLKRYSSFVPFPVNLNGERVNKIEALWMRNRSEIKEEEYTEFYKFQSNAFDEPRYTLHFNADAPLLINSLLFVPKENIERFGFGRMDAGVSLYCKKVLIDAKPEGLLPEWMRFVRGVVDSADLPLNISRESMQDSALVQKLSKVISGRFIKFLLDEAKKRPEAYEEFYKQFGIFIKEGITMDPANKEKLAKLLRYESSLTEKGKTTDLESYVSRMAEEQKEILYLFAPKRDLIESGPYLEAFRSRGREVLFLYDPVDEFVMSHLGEFDGKRLVAADSSDAETEDVSADSEGETLDEETVKALCEWLEKEALSGRVKEVKSSTRLVDSPALAVNADPYMSPGMRRMMQAMNQEEGPQFNVRLEINPRHALVHKLNGLREKDGDLAKLVAEQICDNSMASAGLLEDPRSMVKRIYSLLERI